MNRPLGSIDLLAWWIGAVILLAFGIGAGCVVLTFVVDRVFRVCRSWTYFTDVFVIYVRQGRKAARVKALEWLVGESPWIAVSTRIPAEGADVLLHFPEYPFVSIGCYEGGGQWYSQHVDDDDFVGVTHWQPLPVTPLDRRPA